MSWHSLLLPTTERERAVDLLRALHIARGYAVYDPFPGGTGTPPGFTALVRLFAAPPQQGWLRVLGEVDEAVVAEWGTLLDEPVIVGWLTEQDGGFALVRDGERHVDPAAFHSLLTGKASPTVLQQAFEGKLPVGAVDPASPPTVVLGAESLPPELAQFAQQQGVDARKANKMFDRLSGSLLGKLGQGEDQAQARALFGQGERDVWNSLNGQRVRAIASVLDLPDNWRLPGWHTVRDAYQVHRLRQRSPRMALMPGDREALAAVPDAAEYVPLYLGRA